MGFSRGLYSRAFWLSGLSYISYKIFSFVADILEKSEVVLRIFSENLQFKCNFINNYLFANQFLKYWTGKLLSKYEHETFEGIFRQGFCGSPGKVCVGSPRKPCVFTSPAQSPVSKRRFRKSGLIFERYRWYIKSPFYVPPVTQMAFK